MSDEDAELAIELLKRAYDALEWVTDEGPDNAGWKSEGLQRLLGEIAEFVEPPK